MPASHHPAPGVPFKPLDLLSVTYFSLVTVLIALFAGRVPRWPWYLAAQAAC